MFLHMENISYSAVASWLQGCGVGLVVLDNQLGVRRNSVADKSSVFIAEPCSYLFFPPRRMCSPMV